MKHSVILKSISLNYGDDTSVFDQHSLHLETEKNTNSQLYGIIGPSGVGKTTLLSVLGGQLNPQQGEVLIDNINIYKVGDSTRRTLIGLQMQTSTSLRGNLGYNTRFGLLDESVYSDDKVIEVLQKVGLWTLFKDKKGLETLIGEGGLNLSGGQRQRLNFASLYLRALYYKPTLILIDEPTSSLDEVSELAITRMIQELSQKAITFVVAHRLKTLDQAVGLMDMSMINETKKLQFYSPTELLKKSIYYQDIKSGKALLEA
jgi:ABC-type multidrug transport system fused ATPase/permease subunit